MVVEYIIMDRAQARTYSGVVCSKPSCVFSLKTFLSVLLANAPHRRQFLSHIWSSGQDQAATIKRRLQLFTPEARIFLGVTASRAELVGTSPFWVARPLPTMNRSPRSEIAALFVCRRRRPPGRNTCRRERRNLAVRSHLSLYSSKDCISAGIQIVFCSKHSIDRCSNLCADRLLQPQLSSRGPVHPCQEEADRPRARDRPKEGRCAAGHTSS
jgi:hypothetical protein